MGLASSRDVPGVGVRRIPCKGLCPCAAGAGTRAQVRRGSAATPTVALSFSLAEQRALEESGDLGHGSRRERSRVGRALERQAVVLRQECRGHLLQGHLRRTRSPARLKSVPRNRLMAARSWRQSALNSWRKAGSRAARS